MSTTDYKSRELTRVGENLYRSGKGVYYGRLYVNGKSVRKSFKTHDRKIAEGELAKFVKKIENKEQTTADVALPHDKCYRGGKLGKGLSGSLTHHRGYRDNDNEHRSKSAVFGPDLRPVSTSRKAT